MFGEALCCQCEKHPAAAGGIESPAGLQIQLSIRQIADKVQNELGEVVGSIDCTRL